MAIIQVVGDSIAAGYPTPGGFRWPLADELGTTKSGQLVPNPPYSFTGSRVDERGLRHDGYGGVEWSWLEENLGRLVQQAGARGTFPDVVVLGGGTNSLLKMDPRDLATRRLAAARGVLAMVDPATGKRVSRVLVTTLPPAAGAGTRVAEANAALRGAGLPSGVEVVDVARVVAPADLEDGWHPNAAAYGRMARVLSGAIASPPSRTTFLTPGFGTLATFGLVLAIPLGIYAWQRHRARRANQTKKRSR